MSRSITFIDIMTNISTLLPVFGGGVLFIWKKRGARTRGSGERFYLMETNLFLVFHLFEEILKHWDILSCVL